MYYWYQKPTFVPDPILALAATMSSLPTIHLAERAEEQPCSSGVASSTRSYLRFRRNGPSVPWPESPAYMETSPLERSTSPRHSITETHLQDFFESFGPRFIAAGDFNAKHSWWGSRSINPKGRTLHRFLQSRRLDCHSSGEPTHWPSNPSLLPDLLDFAISKGIGQDRLTCSNYNKLISDHSAIKMLLNIPVLKKSCPEDSPGSTLMPPSSHSGCCPPCTRILHSPLQATSMRQSKLSRMRCTMLLSLPILLLQRPQELPVETFTSGLQKLRPS